MRRMIITGLAVLAAALGTVTAIPAARAALSPSATTAGATAPGATGTTPVDLILARAHLGQPGAVRPAGAMTPAATTTPWFLFYGVSCLSAGNCLAVGANLNGNGGQGAPIASVWNGTAWRSLPVHLPTGATGAELFDVSCRAGGCVAVGYYRRGSAQYPLAEYWKGATLSLGKLPASPSGTADSELVSISCRSPKACLAVGVFFATASRVVAIAETWNGSAWKAFRPPTPSSGLSVLDTVTCVTTTYCLAGGTYAPSKGIGQLSLAEQWNGSTWHQVPVSQPASSPEVSLIDSISCSSVRHCMIIGESVSLQADGTASTRPFAEVRTSAGWSLTSISMPGGAAGFYNHVSCTSATSCMAAGGVGPLASSWTQGHAAWASWNGSAWSVHAINPPPGQGASLWGEGCLSPTSCVAVGTQGKFGTTTGVALTGFWNGSSWRTITTR